MRVTWLLAASSLAACGGITTMDTSGAGDDGSSITTTATETASGGQDGTSTVAGTGGNGAAAGNGGTGGTSGTGGIGAAGGGVGPTYCEVFCEPFDGQCVNGDCVIPSDTLYASVAERLEDGRSLAHAYAFLYPTGTLFQSPTLLQAQGPCQAIDQTTIGTKPPSFDAGTITVQGPNLPTATLTPILYFKIFMSPDVFAPGDVLQFSVAGGPDFPGFSAQTTAPADLDVVVPQVQQSGPLTMSWSPPEPPRYVFLITSAGTKAIFCFPVLPGSIEIPASLLSLLDPPTSGSTATVMFVRNNITAADVPPPARALLSALKFTSIETSYLP